MNVGDATPPQTRTRLERWQLIGGATLMSAALAAYEIVPASVTPIIRDSLGVSGTAVGFLVGIMFGTAMVVSLPVGLVLDRQNSRRAILLAVLIALGAGVFGWLAGQRGEYWPLVGSRIVGGAAYTVVWNAGIDIVGRAAGGRRATAVGVFTASGPIGFAVGQGAGPFIAVEYGWPAIFLVFTGIPVVGLALFWRASRGLGQTTGTPPSPAELVRVIRDPDIISIGLLGFLGYGLYLFVNSWGATYLTEDLGLALEVSGLIVAVFPAVGVVARTASGPISERLFAGRRRPVVVGSFLVAAPILLLFTRLESIGVLILALFTAGFAIQTTLGLSFTYVQELVGPRVAATAVAFQTSVSLAGAFLAPTIAGGAIERWGFEPAFLGAGALAIAGVAVAYRMPKPSRAAGSR